MSGVGCSLYAANKRFSHWMINKGDLANGQAE